MKRATTSAGVWMEWTAPFDDARPGDLELTVPDLARVFVDRRLARVLPSPPPGSRGKAYIAATARRDGADAAPRVRRPESRRASETRRVVNLDARRPHATGHVLCLDCGETWVGVWPTEGDASRLECTACGAQHSRPIGADAALVAQALRRRIERGLAAARETRP